MAPPQDGSGVQDPLIGTEINQYRVVSRLGEGGMGMVYKAEDKDLGRVAALKFLPRQYASSEDARARFVQEAKSASALDHPNIGTIFGIGETESGDLFIAMAYYDGETLEDKIEEGPLPIDEALDYAIQMARALDTAHEKGIVHRDIKPGNVIVTQRGLAKVVDFGLAKMEDVTITRDGTSMGTVAYMSPEQARNTNVDGRADLWALGIVLYEMLAGRRPFSGYEAAILYAAAHEPHPPVTDFRPDTPAGLAVIVDGLLAKKPEERYQSAHEVVVALEAARVGTAELGTTVSRLVPRAEIPAPLPATETQAAVPEVEPATASPPATRRHLIIGMSAIGVLLVVVIVIWAIGSLGGGNAAPPVTPEARQAARAELDAAIEFRDNGRLSLAQARLERAVQLDPEYSAAWASLAAIHTQQRNFLRGIDAGRRAVALDTTNGTAYYNLGFALQETGAPEEAADAYRSAVSADPTMQAAYSALADVLIELNRPSEAISVVEEGIRVAPSSDFRFILDKNMGKALLAMDDAEEALPYLESSLTAQPNWPETLLLLARAHAAVGNPALAKPFRDRYFQVETDPAHRAAAERVFAEIGL